MEFFETVEKRRSIRVFQGKAVDEKEIGKIVEASNHAPSAGNLQAYRITVARGQDAKAALSEAAMGQGCVAEAPVVLVFSADQRQSGTQYGERGEEFYSMQDATIAAAYAQLAATALGLGSVWVGAFDTLEVSRIIDAKEYEVPVAIIPIGYPAEKPGGRKTKSLKELVREI